MKKNSMKETLLLCLAGLVIGAGYGYAVRLIAGGKMPFEGDTGSQAIGVMSVAFLFVMPLCLGFITLWFQPKVMQRRWGAMIFLPWLSVGLMLLGTLITLLEGIICIIMAMPVFFLMASIGGILAGVWLRRQDRDESGLSMGWPIPFGMGLLPILLIPLERSVPAEEKLCQVRSEIEISASRSVIWNEIIRVRPIDPSEMSQSMIYWIGFPKPIEATLSYEGIGGLRQARFEKEVLFLETVTLWEEESQLGFEIKAEHIPSYALDEHVSIGGPFFDVLYGQYDIVSNDEGKCRLILISQERLSTHLGTYAEWWAEWVMSGIQESILSVIKRRAEAV